MKIKRRDCKLIYSSLLNTNQGKNMNKIIFLFSLLLIGLPITYANTTQISSGNQVVANLNHWYNDNKNDCGDEKNPAFLCSGILLRGTIASDNYHSWNLSPFSQEIGGASFSYLRNDSKLLSLAYNYQNGFIFRPYLHDSEGKTHPEVLCYFPDDAASGYRDGHRCGATPSLPQSAPCQQQGITTAQQWIQRYSNNNRNDSVQCGFDVKLQTSGNADAFMQGIQARAQLQLAENNEAVLAAWPQDIPNQLPIEAFFYLSESASGLKGAQHDQKDFYNSTGKVITIIKIKLPSDYRQDATFSYNPTEQAIPN
ncbi:hypothetical protein FE394_03040 [Xenorhabdus sp. Reich]|uniref:Uncharacterized protein n=1 Tax=Xenorhabdus littoralis TaxID=2582835 RepID=A0ABU4SHR9_9GAMM|nr:hypothetical protein [Xenorhabdus sp. Reich]MDX7998197.1 hypothetical protein [Xenorhabdus sp. Reich]